MPSPFPGMNPYFENEGVERDFHLRMIRALADSLAAQVTPNMTVHIVEEKWYCESKADAPMVVKSKSPDKPIDAPCCITLSMNFEAEKHLHLEIRNQATQEPITRVELLTTAVKGTGAGRAIYMKRRYLTLRGQINLVEIDLLRGGARMPAEGIIDCDYSVLVCPFRDRPNAGFWPISLQDRLPRIPVPLREPIPIAWLDLQESLHTVYDRANYQLFIYDGEPEPPLPERDRVWAEEVVSKVQQKR